MIGEKAPDLPGDIVSVDGLPFLAGVMLPGVTDLESAKKVTAAMHAQMKGQTPEGGRVSKERLHSRHGDQTGGRRAVYAMCAKSDRNTVTEARNELLTRDYRPDLGKIKCPILVMGALGQIEALHHGRRPGWLRRRARSRARPSVTRRLGCPVA
ncbi:MAG: hypothetical protein ABI233_05285 [Chthoniobacterales bacterium]